MSWPLFCIISPNSVALGANYVTVVKVTAILVCYKNVAWRLYFAILCDSLVLVVSVSWQQILNTSWVDDNLTYDEVHNKLTVWLDAGR